MEKYLIIIEKAEGNYCAYSPDIPGCVAAAATPEETEREMISAIKFHFEGLLEDGLPIPIPTSRAEWVTV